MLTKMETVELKLHQFGISTFKTTKSNGEPQLTVLYDESLRRQNVNFLDWLMTSLNVTQTELHAMKNCIKETMSSTKDKISSRCLSWFSGEFWHFRPAASLPETSLVSNINVPINALKRSIKMLENAPIRVNLSFFGELPFEIKAELYDESEFVKVMWCICLNWLLLLILDPGLYVGAALVSVVEMYSNFADVCMCTKRLKKICGFGNDERQIYVTNAKKMRAVSNKIIPILAKANKVAKSYGSNTDLPFYTIASLADLSTPAEVSELALEAIATAKEYAARHLSKLIMLPSVVCGFELNSMEDPMWNSFLHIHGVDEESCDVKLFTTLNILLDCSRGVN